MRAPGDVTVTREGPDLDPTKTWENGSVLPLRRKSAMTADEPPGEASLRF
jgi:hypothetical protein